MRGRLALSFCFLAATFAAALPFGAEAMSARAPARHCRVVAGAQFLTGETNGNAVCAEIERAIAADAPHARYSAEVRAMPRSRLSAVLVVNGRTLPAQNFAVMDSGLDMASIRRFAAALAGEVAKAAK